MWRSADWALCANPDLVPFHSIKCPVRCSVTPAEAGVQRFSDHVWIPAFAGMTGRERYFGYSIVWRCT
jgi:hypothetical protein